MPASRVRVFLSAVLALIASLATAAETREAFDRRIAAELKARDAAAAAQFERANAARDRGDHGTAITLYRQVHTAQPTFTHATRRLAGELLGMDQAKEAIALLREAVATEPLPINQATLARALAVPRKQNPPTEGDRQQALTICRDLLQRPAAGDSSEESCATVAMVTDSADLLEAYVRRMEGLAPDTFETLYFAAIAHAMKGEWLRAELDLWKSYKRGMPEEGYRQLRAQFHALWPLWLIVSVLTALAVAVWLVVMALLLAAGLFLSRATLAEANRIPGSAAGAAPHAAALRRVYAAVIGIAGTAYYLSLPLLFVVVLLLGGGLVLAMLAVGHVPVKLLVIVVVTVLWSCWSILRSLSVLQKEDEPGMRLDLAEHPRLDVVLRDVAAEIGTSPIDAVYLTPGTEFGVTERGGLLARVKGTTERALVLGVGVLEGFSLRPFKAVLAHEYGHFVNRDTAGGRFSLSVRRSMFQMARSLAESGSARLSPAWLFLVAFSRLFERISQGASRLQEMMADRWAVSAYGMQAFCGGLRHVIERSARFGFEVQATLAEAQARQTGLSNIYAYRPSARPPEEEIRRLIDEALNRQPSEYDSHPSPRQRFEWARQAGGPGAAADDDAGDAWSLFADKASVETAMTARVFAQA